MLTTRHHDISVADYLDGEQRSEIRHEYIGGRVFAMSSASRRHNLIAGNIFAALHGPARKKGCALFISDMKLRVEIWDAFFYPDLLLSCKADDNHALYLRSPCLMVEVLSPSTETTDRREKWRAYTTSVPSLKQYLIVDPQALTVTVHSRSDDGQWVEHFHTAEQGGAVAIDCLDTELALADCFAGLQSE